MTITLREDQESVIEKLRDAVRRGRKRVIMQGPTGVGKTVIASSIVSNARQRNKHVLFVVRAIGLIDQTIDVFARQGILEVGVIQAQHELTDWSQPVQIASVQTLQRRTIPKADVVLIDEAHRWYRFYEKWFLDPAWKDVPFIGLSATPWTKGLGAYFEELIIASTTQELIEKGLLSPFKVFAPSHPDLTGVRTVAGDYHEGDLSQRMSQQGLVADIVATWLARAERRPTLCFAVDRDHAKTLQQRFTDAGVRTAYQDADTSMEERAQIKNGFHDGSIEVVVNIQTLTTGIDWDVRCIVLARPTKSSILFCQIIGRGLRTAPGKDYCLILDHSDTHLRLGFVTDVDARHSELNDGKPPADKGAASEEPIRLPKECPSCGFLKPPRMAKCSNCGTVAEHVVDQDKRKENKGELAELKKPEYSMAEKGAFYAELKGYAERKGYKNGWASNKYREKFAVWPDHSIADILPAAELSGKTENFIISRNIAWAKSKRRVAA